MGKNKYIWVIIAIVIILGFIFLSKDNKAVLDEADGPIKIGASIPLTGEAASFGEFLGGGLQLAVKEINDAGGIGGRPIELIIEDDSCNAAGVDAFNKLVNIDDVVAIVGPLCSAAAGPALPVAQEAGIPVIVWGSAPALTSVGDYIFRTYPSDSLQGVFAADFIFNTLGKKRAAVMYVKNDWGVGLTEVFTKTFEELGGEIVLEEGAAQESTDLRTAISKAKAANPDVVYAPWYPQLGVVGVKQAKELGLDVPIVAGDAFSSAETLAVPEAEGVLFTQARTDLPEDFAEKVESITGMATNYFTPFAYDSIKILASIIEEVGTDREAIRDALADLSYEDSIATPSVKFDEKGDIEFSEFDVSEIIGGEAVIYTQ